MIDKLKNQKGITLISLIVYVIVMLVVVATVGTITSYFYANVNKQYEESKDESSDTVLDMYLANDLKNKKISVKNADLEDIEVNAEKESVSLDIINLEYEDGTIITYTIVDRNGIYRNAVKIYNIKETDENILRFRLKYAEPNNGSIINEKQELEILKNDVPFKIYTINTKSKAVYPTPTPTPEN